MKTALALVALRLRQARAGRLPWLAAVHLALVGAVLLFAPAPTPTDRLRLALGASLTLATLIAAVGSVAFGASILPDERESRRIHRLLSAPTSRGALAGGTFGGVVIAALALGTILSLLSLPLLALVGDAGAREEVLRSTLRIRPASVEAAEVAREVDGRLWIYGGNPAVTWTVPLDPEDLRPGDVQGEIRLRRRLDLHGEPKDRVAVGVTVEGEEESVVRLGPDGVVPLVVPDARARSGEIRVTLRRLDPAYVLGVTRDSLRLDGRRRTFLPELGLAAVGSGLVAALLAAIAFAISTFASAGVATAAALAVGLVGLLRGFLIEAAGSLLAETGLLAHSEPSLLDRVAAGIVGHVAAIAPDVRAISLTGPLDRGEFATLDALLPGLPQFAIGTAAALLVGWLLLRRREDP